MKQNQDVKSNGEGRQFLACQLQSRLTSGEKGSTVLMVHDQSHAAEMLCERLALWGMTRLILEIPNTGKVCRYANRLTCRLLNLEGKPRSGRGA